MADLEPFAAGEMTADADVRIPEREVRTYPGTGHWFAEPSRAAYRPGAAQLAFARTVAFLREWVR